MKKAFGLVAVVLSIFLITGCGSKKVSCSINLMGMGMDYVATFDGNDKVEKVAVETSVTASDKDEFNEGVKSAEETINNANKLDGVKASLKKSGLKITISLELDLNKITDETLEQLSMDSSIKDFAGMSSKDFKDGMKAMGATCK